MAAAKAVWRSSCGGGDRREPAWILGFRRKRTNLHEKYGYPKLKAQLRGPLLRSKLMAVKGTWQRDGDVRNLIAGHVEDLTALLGGLATSSRDFH